MEKREKIAQMQILDQEIAQKRVIQTSCLQQTKYNVSTVLIAQC